MASVDSLMAGAAVVLAFLAGLSCAGGFILGSRVEKDQRDYVYKKLKKSVKGMAFLSSHPVKHEWFTVEGLKELSRLARIDVAL